MEHFKIKYINILDDSIWDLEWRSKIYDVYRCLKIVL